jgi:hypothetical protein
MVEGVKRDHILKANLFRAEFIGAWITHEI